MLPEKGIATSYLRGLKWQNFMLLSPLKPSKPGHLASAFGSTFNYHPTTKMFCKLVACTLYIGLYREGPHPQFLRNLSPKSMIYIHIYIYICIYMCMYIYI